MHCTVTEGRGHKPAHEVVPSSDQIHKLADNVRRHWSNEERAQRRRLACRTQALLLLLMSDPSLA